MLHYCLVSVTASDVARIRTEYLTQAVLRVSELAAHSGSQARQAAGDLRRYFKWVQNGLLPEQKGPLFRRIQALCRALAAPGSRINADPRSHST